MHMHDWNKYRNPLFNAMRTLDTFDDTRPAARKEEHRSPRRGSAGHR